MDCWSVTEQLLDIDVQPYNTYKVVRCVSFVYFDHKEISSKTLTGEFEKFVLNSIDRYKNQTFDIKQIQSIIIGF